MVAQNIGFAIIAAIMIVGALRVVTTSNVVHAALWLVVVLAGAAAQYILLAAEFLAVTQVLVYIGAVMVLFLFGTMLTRSRIGRDSGLNNSYAKLGIPVAVVLFAHSFTNWSRQWPKQFVRQVGYSGCCGAVCNHGACSKRILRYREVAN